MKRIIALGIVVFILFAGWTGAWFWARAQINQYAGALAEADGVTTPRLVCGSFNVGGFPFGFDVTCGDATVTMADTTVTAKGLKASAEVYNPTHVLVFAQSPVAVADAFSGSQSRVDFASLEASARLDGWRIGRVSLIVEQPVWNDTVLDDKLIAKADHLEAHLVDLPDKHDAKAGLAALGEYVQIDNLDAPGVEIASGKSTFQGEITNLPDDVRTYGEPDLLKRWAAAGGSFDLVDFKGEDTDSNFDATGTFKLDDGGHVGGQLKLSSKGVVERLGTLIPDQWKGLVVGSPDDSGTYRQTLTFAGGMVFSGLVPLGTTQPLF
jgi:hypothetical protein